MTSDNLAERLLDAHVRFTITQLAGADQSAVVDGIVTDLLTLGDAMTLNQVLDANEVIRVVRRVMTTVPPSAGASTLSQRCADVLHAGPSEPFAVADVIARDDVERIIDELVRSEPLIKRVLDEVVESPLVASVVSRFVSRIVGDVVASNRAVAEKIPGIGGLVSRGAGAASKVVGAGASGMEQLLGDTAGKGAQLAARRLNKVAADTLKDPQLKSALMQLWDERSGSRISGLSRIASQDDTRRVIGLTHDVAVHALGSEPVGSLATRLVEMLFATYGKSPVTTLVTDLGLTREDLMADAQRAVAHAVNSVHADGQLEPFIRARLAPFYASASFAAVIGE